MHPQTCTLLLQAAKEFAPYVAPSVKDKHGHTVLRLSMGLLLHTLVKNMEAVAAGGAGSSSEQQPKIFMFSGHDSTIMPLLVGECEVARSEGTLASCT